MGRQPLPLAAHIGMIAWLRRYADHEDPLVAAGNFVALVLAWNQPFYPLYLWFILGRDAWIGLPDTLSGFVFFAIPGVARRHPLLGRALLPVAGMLNVVLCMKLLGEASGIWLLLFPCIMLAALLFRWRERWLMLGLSALPAAAWLLLRGRLGAPPIGL